MEDNHSFDGEQTNGNEKVVINVGGQKHETYINTLKSIPDTRLYWITENPTQLAEYDPNTAEYFFDRHPGVFSHVLNFYRTGKLHCPNDVCGPLFEEELIFWGIDELQVEPCCWLNYKKHREAQAHLDPFEGTDSDGESVEDMDMSVYGLVADSIRRRNRTWWKKYHPKIWTLFEEPYSSIPAQIVAFLTLFFIITSVAIFCLETIPYFSEKDTTPAKVIYIIEVICVAAFTLEFVVRLTVCPNKLEFFKRPMNWIDFGAILPFYLQLFLSKSNIKTIVVLRVVRLIRVFRIFKLSRHSYGLQILGHTLKSSCSELFLLVFFLSIGVVIFSSIIYYAEKDVPNTYFKTIPDGFWWAVVTMTTLGYGDMVPKSLQGKIIGSLCAVCGVLMIALPVPVIVSNFSLYYSHAKARMKLPRRKRPLIFGAASALRVAQPFAVNEHKTNVITQLMHDGSKDNDDDENMGSLRRSLRNSDRRSPLTCQRNSYRSWSPRNINSTPRASIPRASPRQSISSPPEKFQSENLTVPNGHDIELKEIRSNRRQSVAPVNAIPQVVLPSSPPAHLSTSGSKEHFQTPPVSPLSSKHSYCESVTTDKTDLKSPVAKIRGAPVKSLSADSAHGGSPRGRRGRRGSLYIVGFTAKHWQNKALNKNKQRKTLSADNSTEKQEQKEKNKAFYSSLSCENCQHYMKAHSAEVLLRSDSERAEHGVENKTGEPVRSGRRESAVVFNQVPCTPKHQTLPRVSSGTQTLNLDEEPMREFARKESRKTLSDPTKASTTQALGRSNSTSRTSDDSLSVHGHLSQRRGSSPLIRQHAVFTFDMAEQPVSSGGNLEPGSSNNSRLSPSKVLNQATSPTLPALSESVGDLTEMNNTDGMHNSTEQLSPTEGEKNSGKKSKIRPKSLPSGYVNASYQREEEENDGTRRRCSSQDEVKEFLSEPLDTGKRGFQPYRKDESHEGVAAPISSVHQAELSDPSLDSKDQYWKGRRTPVGSVSNASLPSISEEQYEVSSVETFSPISIYKDKQTLHRPASVPSESFTEGFPLSPHIIRATSLPLNGSFERPPHTSNYLYPEYNQRSLPQHKVDRSESLLERRQRPELYLRHVSDSIPQPKQQERISSPYQGVITSPNGKHYPIDGITRFNSISGLDRASSLTEVERMYSFSDGDYPLNADDSLLYSPHTPSSFDVPATKTRDTATSPFITTWNEFDEAPEMISAEHHRDSPRTSSFVEDTNPTPFTSSSDVEVQNAGKFGKLKPSEVELRPISRVEDQAGRKYSLYALPTALEGLVFYAPAPRISIDESESIRHGSHPEDTRSTSEDFTNLNEVNKDCRPDDTGTENNDSVSIKIANDKNCTKARGFSLNEQTGASDRENRNVEPRARSKSDIGRDPVDASATTKRQGSPSLPRLQRTDSSVIYNGHEPLQQKLSGNLHAKRPSSLPSPDRRRARAIFFGDSGISSVGSGSTTSLSHSLELDNESKERKENAANILNPIKETEVENPSNKSLINRIDSKPGASEVENPAKRPIVNRMDSITGVSEVENPAKRPIVNRMDSITGVSEMENPTNRTTFNRMDSITGVAEVENPVNRAIFSRMGSITGISKVENPPNRSLMNRMDSVTGASADRRTPVSTSVNIMLPSKKSRENHVIDILSNSDLYESSVV